MSGRAVGSALLVMVLAVGAYATADAYDVVPGVVTLAAPEPPAEPFPTAPGAVDPPSPVPALAAMDPAVPLPDPAQVQTLVDALVADPRLGPSVGVLVTDQLTGQVLGQRDLGGARTPASTAKLLTAAAALHRLGPASTLPTRVVAGTDGWVVLVGGGDVLLGDQAGDPAAVDGRAGLGDLADQVAHRLTLAGTTTVALGVDGSLFSGPAVHPAWDPAYLTDGYVAAVTALAVHEGRTDPAQEYSQRAADPAGAAGRVLAQRLAERGITVTGVHAARAPAGGAVLGEVRSASVAELVASFVTSSDNTLTEVVARLVALAAGQPGSFDGATQAVLAEVAALGVDTAGARLADASGLAAGSQLSVQTLVQVLRALTDPGRPVLRDAAVSLPVAGLSGTLSDRFATSTARGLLRAKTGSLRGVTSLAGTLVDADGRLLLIAVTADQTGAVGQWNPRAAIDGFADRLAACGCR